MALTNYADLKAAIATRLHRVDLTSQIVDYIDIAEKRICRELHVTSMLATTNTNSLFTNYPELFLYGALIEAAADIKDSDLGAASVGRFREALQECKNDMNASRYVSTLTTEFNPIATGKIIRGY
jgi:hypothetical protein